MNPRRRWTWSRFIEGVKLRDVLGALGILSGLLTGWSAHEKSQHADTQAGAAMTLGVSVNEQVGLLRAEFSDSLKALRREIRRAAARQPMAYQTRSWYGPPDQPPPKEGPLSSFLTWVTRPFRRVPR